MIKISQIIIHPIVPNFSNKEARIIEPATGASTWALGNQRWKKNKGVFTIKTNLNPHNLKTDKPSMNKINKPMAGK